MIGSSISCGLKYNTCKFVVMNYIGCTDKYLELTIETTIENCYTSWVRLKLRILKFKSQINRGIMVTKFFHKWAFFLCELAKVIVCPIDRMHAESKLPLLSQHHNLSHLML